jgi:hypothetical protein
VKKYSPLFIKVDYLLKSHQLNGTVKSARCKPLTFLGMRRAHKYVEINKDQVQHPAEIKREIFCEALKVS